MKMIDLVSAVAEVGLSGLEVTFVYEKERFQVCSWSRKMLFLKFPSTWELESVINYHVEGAEWERNTLMGRVLGLVFEPPEEEEMTIIFLGRLIDRVRELL